MEIHKYKCTNTVSVESSLKTRHPPPPPFPPAGSTLPRAVRSIPAFFCHTLALPEQDGAMPSCGISGTPDFIPGFCCSQVEPGNLWAILSH